MIVHRTAQHGRPQSKRIVFHSQLIWHAYECTAPTHAHTHSHSWVSAHKSHGCHSSGWPNKNSIFEFRWPGSNVMHHAGAVVWPRSPIRSEKLFVLSIFQNVFAACPAGWRNAEPWLARFLCHFRARLPLQSCARAPVHRTCWYYAWIFGLRGRALARVVRNFNGNFIVL